MSVTGILLMAGNSRRYQKGVNKNLEQLNGQTILEYSLNTFIKDQHINNIIIVVRAEEKNIVKNIIASKTSAKTIKIVIGGSTRGESVYKALQFTTSDIVVIHDVTRPLIKQNYIEKSIKTLLQEDVQGVSIAVKSKDTIKLTNNNNQVISTTNRNNTWIIQTPQSFKTDILKKSYQNITDMENMTDDCMVLEKNNYKVKLIEGDYTNLKITTQEDLKIIEMLISQMN